MSETVKVRFTLKALLTLGIEEICGGDTAIEKAEILLNKIRGYAFEVATPGTAPAIVFLSDEHAGAFTEVEDPRKQTPGEVASPSP